jgi:endonuclease/exonuclease/phosphatase family metal-dependent hydrolase
MRHATAAALAALALAALFAAAGPAAAETSLRVMSFNVWGAGANEEKGIEETVAAIRAAGADVVGLQETRIEPDPCTPVACDAFGPSAAPDLAAALGWHVHDQTAKSPALWANAVISRFPITAVSPGDLGVRLDVEGREVWLFNIHLDDEPYQPYQLKGIAYGPAPFISTEAEAVRFAETTRGPAIDLLLADIRAAGTGDAAPVFVTGDFNEPSFLDWTAAVAAAGQKPIAVRWPTTWRLHAEGFADAYRAVHPDPVAKPAYTWTPSYPEDAADDTPDRIDFLLVRGDVKVTEAAIVGEDGPRSDIRVVPWPSDHRAVVATVTLP